VAPGRARRSTGGPNGSFSGAQGRRRPPARTEKLDNPTSKLTRYIDHIMSRPSLKTVRTKAVDNRTRDRISGLWPSDHAGTVATLRLPA
jgi:hypothetical protein